MPPSKILCSKSAQVIEISCHKYGSELQGMERVQLIEAKVRAPGLLTEWALVPAGVSTSCHSQNLPSHIYVLLGSGCQPAMFQRIVLGTQRWLQPQVSCGSTLRAEKL